MTVFIEKYRSISCLDSFKGLILTSELNRQELAIEPDYKEIIPTNMLRRMNKAQRLAVGCALGIELEAKPDGIIVGSGIGCFSNSITFTKHYLKKATGALSPTAFIQSTDNTIAGQIAVITGNHGYNNTYIHKGVAFENALVDACLLINEGKDKVLVGGVDEKLKEYSEHDKLPLGEGASFFLLSKDGNKAKVKIDFSWVLNETPDTAFNAIQKELIIRNLPLPDIVLHGQSFNVNSGMDYSELAKQTFEFTSLSGVYFTNSAFALQLGCEILEYPELANQLKLEGNRILIINEFYTDLFGLTYLSLNE